MVNVIFGYHKIWMLGMNNNKDKNSTKIKSLGKMEIKR